MRPKQAPISRRIVGRARVPAAAAACALVLAACGGGGTEGPKGATSAEAGGDSFALPEGAKLEDLASVAAAAPRAAIPKHAVAGTVDVKVGSHPFAIAANSTTNKVYVANNFTNNVTVIDGKTNKTTTVKAGHEPSAVTVNEKTNKIYVANQGSNDLTVIDGKTNKVTTVQLRPDNPIDIYDGILTPQDVRVNTVTNRIYISGTQSNNVAVIDGKTNKVITNIKTEGLPAAPDAPTASLATSQTGLTPTALAVDEIRNLIYVADFTSNDLTVIDGKTNKGQIIPLVDVQDPYSMKINQKTNKIYIGNLTSRSITVIDGATKAATTISDLPGKPHDVAINEKTNKIYFPAYVLYRGAAVGDDKQILGVVLELDGATNKINTIIAGVTPYAVALNPNTNRAYVMNQDSDNVTVISAG